MVGKSKINPTKICNRSEIIKLTEVNILTPISFNFKHVAKNVKKFKYTEQKTKYFIKLLERLSSISGMNKKEMIVSNCDALRCHPVNFNDRRVSENTFGLGKDIDDDAWQFQISSNKHGRVHGYFVAHIFYIVWLDPLHALYSKKN